MEFDLAAPAGNISRERAGEARRSTAAISTARRPRASISKARSRSAPAKERPGLAGYQFGLSDEEVETSRQPLEDLPQTDEQGKASFDVALDKVPETSRPLEAQITVRLAEAGGRAVERKFTLPVTAAGNMIGVKPLFSGRSLGEGENASFRRGAGRAGRQDACRAPGCATNCSRSSRATNGIAATAAGSTSRSRPPAASPTAGSMSRADKPGRISAPVQWGRYRLEVSSADAGGPVTSIGFDAGWYAEASADTPDMLEIALDKPEYKPGETMTVAVTARTAGKVTINVIGDKLLTSVTQDVQPGTARITVPVGSDWGTGAYVVATLAPPARRQGAAHAGPRHRRAMVLGRPQGAHARARHDAAAAAAAELARCACRSRSTASAVVEQARVVVAAVDVGILNLTNYKPPAPDDYYLGQRRLSAEIRDLYGQLIDGMQGTRGQIKTGGDEGASAERQSADASAARALLRHCRAAFRTGGGCLRHPGLRRHGPRHGGGLEQGQGRPRQWRRHRARSGGADRDLAALPADRRPELDESRPRQCRGPGRRLSTSTVSADGPVKAGDGAAKSVQLRAKQRDRVVVPLAASGSGTSTVKVAVNGSRRFRAGAQLRART